MHVGFFQANINCSRLYTVSRRCLNVTEVFKKGTFCFCMRRQWPWQNKNPVVSCAGNAPWVGHVEETLSPGVFGGVLWMLQVQRTSVQRKKALVLLSYPPIRWNKPCSFWDGDYKVKVEATVMAEKLLMALSGSTQRYMTLPHPNY